MNAAWLLKSSTLWGILGLSGMLSTLILWISPDGFPSLRKRQAELHGLRSELVEKSQRNRQLLDEVNRLCRQDPELMEALARRQGFARPGEVVYTFKDRAGAR